MKWPPPVDLTGMLLPMTELPMLDLLTRLGLAVVLGAVIGIDRQILRKPAGIRTLMLVSLGSAAFTVVGMEAMHALAAVEESLPTAAGVRLDTSRVIAGIVGGIGFLGAGTIIQSRGSVEGVTTASSIWVTAAVGVASGLGQFSVAMAVGLIAAAVLISSRFLGSRGQD